MTRAMTPELWAAHQAMYGRGKPSPPILAVVNAGDRPIGSPAVVLELPWPPTVNNSSGPTSNGGRYLTKMHKEFRHRVRLVCISAELGPPRTGRIRVDITLHQPTKRAFDIDNRIKGVLDALESGGVFVDDEQIDALSIARGAPDPTKVGRCVVTITELA
jgi:crossover junction endodeoxyribonuclease RusA